MISVDTKKKELVGPFKGGRELRPKGAPEQVLVHDFLIPDLGRVSPYGVYDIGRQHLGSESDGMGYGCWPKGGRPLKWLRLWRESLIPSETGWTTFAKAGPKVWSLSRLGVPPRLEPRSTEPTEVCGAKSAWGGGD